MLFSIYAKLKMDVTNHAGKPTSKFYRSFVPNSKVAKRRYLARYCDESNGSFELLPKLFYGTFNNCGNTAG